MVHRTSKIRHFHTPRVESKRARQEFRNRFCERVIRRAYAENDNFCNPAEKEIKSFEVDDANSLILKLGLKTGLDFHNIDDKSIILISLRDNELLISMGKFGVSELYRLAAVGCQMSPRRNTENRAR